MRLHTRPDERTTKRHLYLEEKLCLLKANNKKLNKEQNLKQ